MQSSGRRQFVLVASLLAAMPRAWAQRRANLPLVGVLYNSVPVSAIDGSGPQEPLLRLFLEELARHGYVEGRNVTVERRTAEGRMERIEGMLAEYARRPVSVIVVSGNAATMAAKKVTTTIPVVVAGMGTPVELGFVKSLSRPGGNITGFAPTSGDEVEHKRLQIIREMLPASRRVAYLGLKSGWETSSSLREVATRLGFTMTFVDARLPRIEEALEQLKMDRPDALFVPPISALYVYSRAIAEFSARAGIPDFHGHLIGPELGGLAAFGHDAQEIWRRTARYVARILNGAKPGDLPVELMDRYALVVNRRAAKALQLTVPGALLARADRVID